MNCRSSSSLLFLFLFLTTACGTPAGQSVDASAEQPQVHKVALLSPTGGEVWAQHSAHTVQWLASDDVSTVRLELVQDEETIQVLDEAMNADDGELTWTIDSSVSGPVQIRISDVNKPDVSALSPVFTIVERAIVVSSPDADQTFGLGGVVPVRWETLGDSTTMDIVLTEGGVEVSRLASREANDGEWDWQVPAETTPGDYRVLVRSSDDDGFAGSSEIFSIIDSGLSLTAPSAVETWAIGSEHVIEWSGASEDHVDVEVWREGQREQIIAQDISGSEVIWAISPDSATGDVTIQVAYSDSPDVRATSNPVTLVDLDFQVTEPTSNTVWNPGATAEIRWTRPSNVERVDVELWRDGALIAEIAQDEGNDGTLDLVVPDLPGASTYTVQLIDHSTGAIAQSAQFAIAGWTHRVPIRVWSEVEIPTPRPLLILLHPGVFDSGLATSGGNDLRASTSVEFGNGFDLPLHVATWNPVQTSRVWVRLPSVPQGWSEFTLWVGADTLEPPGDFEQVFVDIVRVTGADVLPSPVTADAVIVESTGTLRTQTATPLEIQAPLVIVEGSIDVSGLGYPGGNAEMPGDGPGGGLAGISPVGGSGAGYGGAGGDGVGTTPNPPGGAMYGTASGLDCEMGSGGGGGIAAGGTVGGGSGGGAVLVVADRMVVTGSIVANGVPHKDNNGGYGSGSGSGGGIRLNTRTIHVSGTLEARGGGTPDRRYANGAGGRIKVFHGSTHDIRGVFDVAEGSRLSSQTVEGATPGSVAILPTNSPAIIVEVLTPQRLP